MRGTRETKTKMLKEKAESYIGKTLHGHRIDDVGNSKFGWIAWFGTQEGTRWAYLQDLLG